VDAETRQLLRDGSEVHVSPKAFALLCTLVEQRPRVVEKAELLERIWPGTFVVDANLNVLIGEIRRAVDDNAREPKYVRTVHGVGYAFCGEAHAAEPSPSPHAAAPCWLISKEKTFRLAEGANTIGRDPSCAVWLDSPSVSRRHARITVDSATRRVVFEDLNSTNGCIVRGALIREPVELVDGEPITIGSVAAKAYLWTADTAAKTIRIPRRRR
jgi:DNA-binding winged helix-turn-helix (wHTH) protein